MLLWQKHQNMIFLHYEVMNLIPPVKNEEQPKNIIKFNLPIENSLRTLISYKKLKVTNLKYPRKYNEIKNKEI